MLLQSFIVYSSLTAVMLILAWQAGRSKDWSFMLLAVLAFSVIFGYRYGVGRDFFMYQHMFNKVLEGLDRDCEWGFEQLMLLIHQIGWGETFFFAITSFIPLYLVVRAVKDEPDMYVPVIAVFMLYAFWQPTANVVRQVFAFGFFAVSIKPLQQQKWLLHYALIAIAFLFHKSALALVIVYPIYALNRYEAYIKDVGSQLIIFALAFLLMQFGLVEWLIDAFFNVIVLLGYADSAAFDTHMYYEDFSLGLGFIIRMSVNLMIICHSKEIKEHFKSTPVAIIYDIWFVGMILSVIFVQSMSITRMLLYFTQLAIFVMAYALEYFRREKPDYFWVMLALMLLTFVATIMDGDSNTATYIFNWQDEHFHLKKAFMKL
nr:EpsG family protein [Bacteroidales bacterium]